MCVCVGERRGRDVTCRGLVLSMALLLPVNFLFWAQRPGREFVTSKSNTFLKLSNSSSMEQVLPTLQEKQSRVMGTFLPLGQGWQQMACGPVACRATGSGPWKWRAVTLPLPVLDVGREELCQALHCCHFSLQHRQSFQPVGNWAGAGQLAAVGGEKCLRHRCSSQLSRFGSGTNPHWLEDEQLPSCEAGEQEVRSARNTWPWCGHRQTPLLLMHCRSHLAHAGLGQSTSC